MAEIRLVRIDFRLVHGQVATQWVRLSGANRIVVANDELAADEFMADIYRMAAPQGIKVDIYSVAEFCEHWKANGCGDGKLLVIFKSVDDAAAAYDGGFTCDDIQIGGLGGGEGRAMVSCGSSGVSFDEKDIETLRRLSASGVNVHVHVVPSAPDMSLSQVVDKLGW